MIFNYVSVIAVINLGMVGLFFYERTRPNEWFVWVNMISILMMILTRFSPTTLLHGMVVLMLHIWILTLGLMREKEEKKRMLAKKKKKITQYSEVEKLDEELGSSLESIDPTRAHLLLSLNVCVIVFAGMLLLEQFRGKEIQS